MRTSVLSFIAALLASAALAGTPNSWPAPKYQLRLDENIMMRMRDGVRLAADLYVPLAAGDKVPAILIRTPYDKTPFRRAGSDARHLAGQGYVVAVQDVRGKYRSEGEYSLFAGDVPEPRIAPQRKAATRRMEGWRPGSTLQRTATRE